CVAGSHGHPRGSARIFRPGTATSPGPGPFQTRRADGNELYLRKLLSVFVLGKFVSPPPTPPSPGETQSRAANRLPKTTPRTSPMCYLNAAHWEPGREPDGPSSRNTV